MVAPRLEPRGTSEYTLNLARELVRNGVQVSVFCAPGPMLNPLRQAGIECQEFEHLESFGLHLTERRRFLEAVAAFDPPVVHGQTFAVAGTLGLLSKETRLPLVLTLHWVPADCGGLRHLSRRLGRIIATTQAVREALVNRCGVAKGKVRVIANGVDVEGLDEDAISPIFRSRTPVVGSLGPVEEQRGHELFVKAIAQLVRAGTTAQFVVAGEGEELPQIRALIARLGLEHRVTLACDISTYGDVLDALDVVVQSSLVNISGFSILTAMARGRPVVAFNTGTACEIIQDGQTGLLVPRGDVQALAAAIGRLIGDSDEARRMGLVARRRVREKFNIRDVARQTLDCYKELLNG